MTDGVLPDLVLASASPRRRELLEQLGLALQVTPADIDETPAARRAPGRIRAARRRREVRRRRRARARPDVCPSSAADTIVIVDDEILGQPRDEDDARADAAPRWRGAVTR